MNKQELNRFIDKISPTGPGGIEKIKKVLKAVLDKEGEEGITEDELLEALAVKQDTIQDLSEIRLGAALANNSDHRPYNSSNPDGMGYLVLKKNKTFAEQVTEENTIYEIRYHFNLGGNSVNIPAGCTLKFNGGDISNGSVVYNNTEIQGNSIIDCTCTGGLRNSVVTPQMYGAKADGVTDDKDALRNAASYNDCIFLPAGEYATTQPISMRSGMTLYGVGRESKIVNDVTTGFNKVCISTGDLTIGSNTGSFLNITPVACTISSDRWSLLVSDTSGFQVGDLVFVSKDEVYTATKNPPRYWIGKIVEIVENTSIRLDYYIDNDELVGVNCLVRDLRVLPNQSDRITENICIHDLSLINKVDSGSGMYVFALTTYKAEIYNIWSHGNTIIGSNFLVNASLRNIVAEYDGGFLDIPEINQNVEVCGCRATRFGSRVNVIGMTFTQGYKAYIHDNFIDIGNNGKIGVGQHIRAIIKNNVFKNVKPANGRPIELSIFGNCIFEGNMVSSDTTTSIIDPGANTEGHIIKDNYIENRGTVRWIEGFTTFKYAKNIVKGNMLTNQNPSDAYYNSFPPTAIATPRQRYSPLGTKTIAAGETYTAFSNGNGFTNARSVRITYLLQSGNYDIVITGESGSSQTISLANATWIEIYVGANSNYASYRCDGDNAGSYRVAYNHTGALQTITIKNKDAEARAVYTNLVEAVIE